MGRSADFSDCRAEEQLIWDKLVAGQEENYTTFRGLTFTYQVRGNEIFFSRREKSVTRATVQQAYRRAEALSWTVSGPKKLGVFGASYLYPVFLKLGVIRSEAKEREDS